MAYVVTGTVRGNTIVLDSSPGLPEGQRVKVVVHSGVERPAATSSTMEDSWPVRWNEEDDQILVEVYQARK